MALKYVVGFIYPSSGPDSTHYDVYYDTGSNSFDVITAGPDPQLSIDLSAIGYTEGEEITLAATCSDSPDTTKLQFFIHAASPFASVVLTPDSPDCPLAPPPGTCDLAINSLSVTNETATGANDGTVSIAASSTGGAITYSLDGITYTSGSVFSGLAPGNYTAYVKDASDCLDQRPFIVQAFINPVQSFSDDLPVLNIGGGNISRWSAAFNPIIVRYQRKDFTITAVAVGDTSNQIKVTLSTTLPFFTYRLAITDNTYFKTALYQFNGLAIAYSEVGGFGVLTFNEPFVGNDTDGYLNINAIKPGYVVQTQIKYGLDPVHPKFITAEHSPSSYDGATRADLSPFLQTIVQAKDEFNYTDSSYTDTNLSASYQISFRESWDGGTTSWFNAPNPLYVTYSAFQLQEQYGGNMAQYVPFLTVSTPDQLAQFITDWKSPYFYHGLPFDLSFINSESVINKQLYIELLPDCGDVVNGLLLNTDAGHLTDVDSSRFIISRNVVPGISGYPVIQALGLTRCLVPDSFDCCARLITAKVYYLLDDGTTKQYITAPLIIKSVCPCETEPYVYIKWINSKGAWDYYKFGFNQELNANISNDFTARRFVLDWQNGDTIEDNVSKSSIPSIKVGADNVDQDTANVLQWARKSIKVMMLTGLNPIKWQTVIVKDGSTDGIQTRKKTSSVGFELVLRNDNLQNQ